jgi:hypothetical protein
MTEKRYKTYTGVKIEIIENELVNITENFKWADGDPGKDSIQYGGRKTAQGAMDTAKVRALRDSAPLTIHNRVHERRVLNARTKKK